MDDRVLHYAAPYRDFSSWCTVSTIWWIGWHKHIPWRTRYSRILWRWDIVHLRWGRRGRCYDPTKEHAHHEYGQCQDRTRAWSRTISPRLGICDRGKQTNYRHYQYRPNTFHDGILSFWFYPPYVWPQIP